MSSQAICNKKFRPKSKFDILQVPKKSTFQSKFYSSNNMQNIVTIIVSLYINNGTPRDLEHFGNPKNEKILKETLCFDKFLEDYFRKVRLC